MKKILLLILLGLPLYLVFVLGRLDKDTFVSPVGTNGYILIRSDSRGDGLFASKRSGRRLHNGIDLSAQIGTPVVAVRSGMVAAATSNTGMGNYVIIRHPDNTTTIYGHLSEICVTKGAFVRQGKVVGKVGKTGNANYRDIQPHLHFEVRKDGHPQDPLAYLQ